MELLQAFGPLKSFHQVREPGMTTSKGYAFCEYASTDIAEQAIKGLNGMPLGDKTMTVRFAVASSNTPSSSTSHIGSAVPALGMPTASMAALGAASVASMYGNMLGAAGTGGAPLAPASHAIAQLQPTRVRVLLPRCYLSRVTELCSCRC
jgi:hypothetical protein